MHVALIDYGSGNLRSAEKALVRAAAESGSAQTIVVTSDPDVVRTAGRIVLPGVGAFADCMAGLTGIAGLREALQEAVGSRGVPFLGICVGMQLLATQGVEFGTHAGLGWIAGTVVRLTPGDPSLKVPHMGWNSLHVARSHPLLNGIAEGAYVYFVHSFAMHLAAPADALATTQYGGPVTAMIAHGNIAGTQFHPEKSQGAGLTLLANFLAWQP